MSKGSYSDFFDTLGFRESSNRYDVVNIYGSLGRYQMGEASFVDIGLYTTTGNPYDNIYDGTFTGKYGVYSVNDFLAKPAAQDQAIRDYMALQFTYLAPVWAYDGQTINGVTVTVSGLLAAAHILGWDGAAAWLNSGGDYVPTDNFGTPITEYATLMGDYDTPFLINHDVAESVAGGSGPDYLIGRGGNDTLAGKGGNDTLSGGTGNDNFVVGAGTDIITDLGGSDVVTIAAGASVNASVTAPWIATAATSNGGNGNLNTAGFSVDLSAINSGSAGFKVTNSGAAARFFGSALADTLIGGSGNDTLNGGGGNDSLTGGAGDDVFNVGAGIDAITDLAGGDSFNVSSGATLNAKVIANWTAANTTINAGVVALTSMGFDVNLSSVSDGTIGYRVTNTAGTAATLTGSKFADTLVGGAGADTLVGGAGNDSLTGNGGNDTFTVASGTDSITDLSGGDIVIVASGATLNATLSAAWTATAGTTNAGTANLTSAGFAVNLAAVTAGSVGYNVTNTGAATTLTGSSFADTLVGGAGADTLIGGAGNDTLIGGIGNDSLTGGSGNDSFTVGSGTDAIRDLNGSDVLTVASGAIANTSVSAAWTATVGTTNAGTANLTSAGFAVNLAAVTAGTLGYNVTNTGAATTLTGSSFADTLVGGAGADTLIGGAGNDVLTGGAGNDTFTVASGTDSITDLSGGDIVTVASGARLNGTVSAAWTATVGTTNAGTANLTSAGFAVNLAAVTAGTLGYSVTNTAAATTLTGSSFADTLTGGTGNDTLVGGAGNDFLLGGTGIDSLTGGAGDDILTGGAGADTFVFNQLTGVDHITDFTTASDHINLSKATFAALGAVGTLGSTAFYAAAGATTGHLATDRVIYNTTTGALYYDADGNGSGAAVQIGVLDGHPTLVYTDVLIF